MPKRKSIAHRKKLRRAELPEVEASIVRVLQEYDNVADRIAANPRGVSEDFVIGASASAPRGGGVADSEIARHVRGDLKSNGLAPTTDVEVAFDHVVTGLLRSMQNRGLVEAVTGLDTERVSFGAIWAGIPGEAEVGGLPVVYSKVWRLLKPRDGVTGSAGKVATNKPAKEARRERVGGDDLREPVCVAHIAKVLPRKRGGGRSDKLAERLSRMGARLAKLGGKWNIERADALRLLPAYKKWCTEHPSE